MLFNSLQFLFFFPLVTLAYFLLPFKFRWLLLLVASCWFYCAFIPLYILILFFTIAVDYIAGIYIEKNTEPIRRLYLLLSITANVGVLAIFKYYNFFISNYNHLLHALQIPSADAPFWHIILPIGLSFHTFQTMSYTIEVYRGHQKAERHLGIYALYVLFYPQLMAGPIERPQNLLHQFREKHCFDPSALWWGLRQMLWGLFKKSVIADRLAAYVGPIFVHPHQFSQGNVLLAAVLFSFQAYCDFSGYSDIAIGAARVMGFKLMTNFNRPFTASNPGKLWQRWHISLSTWFRDYLYIPLGGNRGTWWRRQRNTMITFLVSGLWHGANWNYVLWGGLHGLFVAVYNVIFRSGQSMVKFNGRFTGSVLKLGGTITTFLLFTFAIIFFRAGSLSESAGFLKCAFKRPQFPFFSYPEIKEMLYGPEWFLLIGMLIAFLMISDEVLHAFGGQFTKWQTVDSIWLGLVLFLVLTLGVFNQSAFIYFQF